MALTYEKEITGLVGDRSIQRFHLRGRQGMGIAFERTSPRSQSVHSSYAASARCRTKSGHPRFLCTASSIPV